MKKKIKNLTLGKIKAFCDKTECQDCPLHTEKPSLLFQDYKGVGCSLGFGLQNFNSSVLESEVEVDE